MLENFSITTAHIIFACGVTDFRKQADSLSSLVFAQFQLDPYEDDYIFVFCNKKRNAIKMLRYDHDGFVLASKKLLDGMKFQWPRTPDEITEVTQQQLKWLLDGLLIEQKSAHHDVKMSSKNSCFWQKMSDNLSTETREKSAFFNGSSCYSFA